MDGIPANQSASIELRNVKSGKRCKKIIII